METPTSPTRSLGDPDAAEPRTQAHCEPLPAGSSLDHVLLSVLISNGLLTGEQIQDALNYGRKNHLDLRQAILELNLIAPERLNALAFERLTSLAEVNGAKLVATESNGTAGLAAPLSPDRTKLQLDMRQELKELATTASIPDLINQILACACESRATDVHLDPTETGVRVRFRIDGQLQEILLLEPSVAMPLVSRLKVMSNLNIVDRRHSQDGRITIQHANRARDLRMATFPTALGEKIVIRIHDTMGGPHGFERLGMPLKQSEQLDRLISQPYGAVLVAGPVGSGKTTTLYSCLSKVNSPTRNVMTIEDPIETRIPGTNQTQVSADLHFSEGLRSMLRQDPDVIMIGEIRDDETARIGIRAAVTGVLVFSSVHGSDAPSTIGNLYNFGIPGYQLSNSLVAIVSQRLVRKICPYCRVNRIADAKLLSALDLDPEEHEGLVLHYGLGCPACFQTGYLGRTGIFEIMEINDELRDLIFQQIPKDVLRRVAIDLGMQTLKRSAVDKILEGTTTVEEVFRVVSM
ncbi:type IV pilus assembly protein PilB [Singulisphaera sp. GP187]|uniref:GspE/PulE family protein n=1 Tax=Singulisphaera sp. GP187 TaxID=1882752 RepID=UPI000927445B|nr:GspE/PulE family protein [Singulisphaera sp. GP187]SIO66195.1 type IV pilus assembly protein PilB [Singulisphaera sp. GP187]